MMWELIQENKRKSWVLFVTMGICLVLLGFFIGKVWFGVDGGFAGIIVALVIWGILSLVSYYSGDSILLLSSRAKKITHEVHPQLFNVVEEMKIAANLPVMPRIYIIDDPGLNAFATGRNLNRCSIAVTAGLLAKLNRDELQGVIAHEMSHILNRDVLYMTFAGVMLGSIVILSEVFLRSMFYSGSSRRYRGGSKNASQGQGIILLIALLLAILAPILARIFYFAISRKREYLADASAVRLNRYPQGLASALEKISNSPLRLSSANKVTAPMYIVNPFKKDRFSLFAKNIFSTHPPVEERIRILRSMTHDVSYKSYQEAFSAIKGKAANVMPPSALHDSQTIPVRKGYIPAREEQTAKSQARIAGDLMRVLNNYAFLVCACGMKIKIPPNFNKEKISCPRCGRELEIPLSNLKKVVIGASAGMGRQKGSKKLLKEETPQIYKRHGNGWESFSCRCGELIQISPAFCGKYITCRKCHRKIEIRNITCAEL